MQIISRNGTVLYECEAATVRECVVAAMRAGANLYGANLTGANLYGADLTRANLTGANLTGADLTRAYLTGANLTGVDISRANLSGANLTGVDISRANLYGANLSGANLSGANLSGANLSGADLTGADLYGANLSGAYLSGANLSGANLSGAYLYGATGIAPERYTPLLMLLDQPGPIRAYKLVTAAGVGPWKGYITYEVGQSYDVLDANTDPMEQCGAGINVATLDWCLREWRPGYRVLVVEFTAADIACIPTGTKGKFRLHRCTVVSEKDVSGIVATTKPEVTTCEE